MHVRFDKDGKVTFSKQINYFQKGFHNAQYVFNRECGDQRIFFMIRLLSQDLTKVYRIDIARLYD